MIRLNIAPPHTNEALAQRRGEWRERRKGEERRGRERERERERESEDAR